jgi:membrane associated rhomboid family serine protease
MPDPLPERSDEMPRMAPTIDPAQAGHRLEAEATARVLHVWSVLPGRLPWATFGVVALAIVLTGLAAIAREPVYRIFYASSSEVWQNWKWWGLLGSVFLHGSVLHLFFNCYWIWIFGRLLEREIGSARFVGVFLAGAWFGSVAELAWAGSVGIGLSGVVYGLFGYLLVNRSRHPDFRRMMSAQTIKLLLGWLILCFPLTYFGILHIANFAHLGGLVMGCVLGATAFPNTWRKLAQFGAVGLGLVSVVPLFWSPQHEVWLMNQATRALTRRDYDRALEVLPRINRTPATKMWALQTEGVLRLSRKEYGRARDCLVIVAEDSPDANLLNTTAWLLATCPVANIRDGAKAVRFARAACGRDKWKNAAFIDTLAAAYAEAGNFAEAEKWMLKALENPGAHAAALATHLDAFRAQKPWREP